MLEDTFDMYELQRAGASLTSAPPTSRVEDSSLFSTELHNEHYESFSFHPVCVITTHPGTVKGKREN